MLSTGTYHWVFAVATHGLSTPEVYAELDRQRSAASEAPPGPDASIDALRSGDTRRLAPTLHNDLQSAALALAPGLRRTLAAGRELGALAGLVCGSGPTCAFLVADQAAAHRLAAALPAEGVCRTTKVATAPAPGARVLRD